MPATGIGGDSCRIYSALAQGLVPEDTAQWGSMWSQGLGTGPPSPAPSHLKAHQRGQAQGPNGAGGGGEHGRRQVPKPDLPQNLAWSF
jgi:hypothetical protein